jgi:hypothetical protein
MDLDATLSQLTRLGERFPREALRRAIALREEITPELIEMIRWTTEHIEEVQRDGRYIGHFVACFLLAQFRETRAYRPIVALFSTPGEAIMDICEDFVPESLPQVLASVYDGDLGPIQSLIESPRTNEWVRGAAVRSLEVLVVEGALDRDQVMAYCAGLLRGGLEREESHVWNAVAGCCCDLYPQEVAEDLQKALDAELIDLFYLDADHVQEVLDDGREKARARLHSNPHYHYILDTVEELESWAMWEEPALASIPRPPGPQALPSSTFSERPQTAPAREANVPARSTKVGRNDPCPCGSGRKYKHCCGKRV